MKKTVSIIFGLLFAIFITACGAEAEIPAANSPEREPTQIALSTPFPTLIPAEAIQSATQGNLLGNHTVDGNIDLETATQLNIPLSGEPLWLVSAPLGDGALFVAVMADGTVQAFNISGQTYAPYPISPAQLPAGMPPLLAVSDDNAQLVLPPDDASLLTNVILLNNKLAYIATNGDLVVGVSTGERRLSINALPDARILVDESNRLLILTQPIERYTHGVLGDAVEAAGITLIETEPDLRIIQNIPIEAPDVIEGISPIWADIDHDGVRDIIVTLSNRENGARIVAYHEDGTLFAESAPIGTGYRWRHQIAVAAFGQNTEPTLVSIRTPHIGGVVEFFQFKDGQLALVGKVEGFSSHSIGSRNLDSAIAGDFNKDGISELLAPDQSHTNLGIITTDGVITLLPLDGVLTSNLSTAVVNGNLIVGAGTQGKLRVWIQ